MKKYEKYIKVVERNGKDEKSKLGGVAPRVRAAGRGAGGHGAGGHGAGGHGAGGRSLYLFA